MFTTIRYTILSQIVMAAVLFAGARVHGQISLVDDIIIVSQGQRQQDRARTDNHLGIGAGQSGSLLGPSPGSGETVWREHSGPANSQPTFSPQDVATAASAPPGRATAMRQRGMQAPTALPSVQALPVYGPLEIPALDELGPAYGLSLDAAINQLLSANYELRAKYQEIPKAQSDLLSAGLRNNPLLFASADNVPYGSYSQARPGENSYGVTVIQPFDLNHKRGARVAVATRARRVIEAQYQDACRQEIDSLYTAFVDMLAAREAVRYAQAGLVGFDAVVATTQSLVHGQEESRTELERMEVQREAASIALDQAQLAFEQAKQNVALLLNIPDAAAQQLEIYGTIRQTAIDVPPVDDAIGLAMQLRPDLAAFRLGVGRAQAEVQLAQREAVPDFFVLYTPYSERINSPLGAQNATSWGIGGFTSIPLLNRNQGNIARARQTVSQTRIETAGVERRIATEVRQAHLNYQNAKSAVERFEESVLPKARRIRDAKYGLLTKGQEQALVFLDAQREYNEIVRQYRDTLVRRRRAILKLNTVVGQRLFP
ncbi:MAG: TolC family protein [Pirellulales bacterium]